MILYKVAPFLILTYRIVKGFTRYYLGLVLIKERREIV